jgi:hypothetical protein
MKTIAITVITSAIILSGIIFGIIILQKNYYNNQLIINENDLSCFTAWNVQLNSDVDYKTLENILRNKIAEFGNAYDIDQREITIENIGNNYIKITVEGAWWPSHSSSDSKERNLRESILSVDSVKNIEDFIDGPVEAGCQ